MKTIACTALFVFLALSSSRANAESQTYDAVVYGGTPAAITAAIEIKRQGLHVVMVCPDQHLGGMTSSGLGWTDSKDGKALGGLAREFYHRVWLHYQDPQAWRYGDRAEYAKKVRPQPGTAIDDKGQVMWTFEPHVAEAIFNDWLKEVGVPVEKNEWLDRKGGVDVANHSIRAIRMTDGKTYQARIFIDATYEGDLMAAAGVTCRMGRDTAAEYHEPFGGIYFHKPKDPSKTEASSKAIDPYLVPGDPTSGFIPGVEGPLPASEHQGDADTRLQSFNYRLCLTTDPQNQVAIQKPAHYKASDYEMLFRLYASGQPCGFSMESMPNHKTDSNNSGRFSLDYVGGNFSASGNWNYSTASYEERNRILQDHRDYTQGLLWTIMNDPRIPEADRKKWSSYGLAADEFVDTDHWPFQLYVREARRMVGNFVMTQHHILKEAGYEITDSIGLGSYSLDSHVVRRIVEDGHVSSEGTFYQFLKNPYPLSLGIIEPKEEEMTNLLDPVTVSATHVAFGSIRMEPTYMILGQSAGAVAVLAIKGSEPVQKIAYPDLRSQLLSEGQVLDVKK